ncbi:hypothetical protein J8273_5164 [Carpediemonas membranifera]|uniref:Transmembrane protein n=1 Tax=Carpediemonas membranifera TaxID=201153 RepID=A0A8J6E0G4_9EUKA|nr:hypothetical protein J8273_5164 [Carpediemonas membranifera]|eukprot:KAG9392183.1 hypothetical protein J8273_5164 [Carpediemonas membranifera]
MSERVVCEDDIESLDDAIVVSQHTYVPDASNTELDGPILEEDLGTANEADMPPDTGKVTRPGTSLSTMSALDGGTVFSGLSMMEIHDAARISGIPWPILMKLVVRDAYNNNGKQKRAMSRRRQASKSKWRRALHRLRVWWRDRSSKKSESLPIMRKQLKEIEGRFGTGVLTFFSFQRDMALLNTWIAFIWLPVLFFGLFAKNWLDNFDGMTWWDWVSSAWYARTPLFYSGYGTSSIIQWSHYPLDWVEKFPVVGGWMETIMDEIRGVPIGALWIIACILTFALSYVALLMWLKKGLVMSNTGSISKNERFPNCSLVFGSWNHSLSNKSAVDELNRRLGMHFKEMCEARRIEVTIAKRSLPVTLMEWSLRTVGFIFSCIVVIGTAVAVLLCVQVSQSSDLYVVKLGSSLVIQVVTNVAPIAVRGIAEIERWHDQSTRMAITLARMWLVKATSLAMLVYELFSVIDINVSSSDVVSENTNTCPTLGLSESMATQIVSDFVLTVVFAVAPNLIPIVLRRDKDPVPIGASVVDTSYRQALIWIGCLLGPGNAILGAVSSILLFYLLYWITKYTNGPEKKAWPADKIDTYVNGTVLATLFACTVPLCLFMLWVGKGDNEQCGPFVEHGSGWKTFTNYLEQKVIPWVKSSTITWYDIFEELFNPVLLAPTLVLVASFLYLAWGLWTRVRADLAASNNDLSDTRKQMSAMLNTTKSQSHKKLEAAISILEDEGVEFDEAAKKTLLDIFDESTIKAKHDTEDLLMSTGLKKWVRKARDGLDIQDMSVRGIMSKLEEEAEAKEERKRMEHERKTEMREMERQARVRHREVKDVEMGVHSDNDDEADASD